MLFSKDLPQKADGKNHRNSRLSISSDQIVKDDLIRKTKFTFIVNKFGFPTYGIADRKYAYSVSLVLKKAS